MQQINSYLIGLVSLLLIIMIFSCDDTIISGEELEETFEPVEKVIPVSGGDRATLIVNRSDQTYFTIEFRDITSNSVIENGTGEGWCIDWQKPIDSNGGRYEDIKLYSTFQVEKWKPTNYLLNIKDELHNNDPDLTYREMQVAIWAMQGFPEFDLDEIEISTEDIPSRMMTNGEPNFSFEKVRAILERVNNEYRNFEFTKGTKYAVIAETPADVQTVITVVE